MLLQKTKVSGAVRQTYLAMCCTCCKSDLFSIPETWTNIPLVEELCAMVVHSMSRITHGLDISYLKSSSILHVGEMRGGADLSSN